MALMRRDTLVDRNLSTTRAAAPIGGSTAFITAGLRNRCPIGQRGEIAIDFQ
jgi:hypothetical protein